MANSKLVENAQRRRDFLLVIACKFKTKWTSVEYATWSVIKDINKEVLSRDVYKLKEEGLVELQQCVYTQKDPLIVKDVTMYKLTEKGKAYVKTLEPYLFPKKWRQLI